MQGTASRRDAVKIANEMAVGVFYNPLSSQKFFCAFLLALAMFFPDMVSAKQQPKVSVEMALLRLPAELSSAVPAYLRPADNDGEAGASRAVDDANGTGKFLGQRYTLSAHLTDTKEAVVSEAKHLYEKGIRLFLADMDTPALKTLRDALPSDALIFNYGNQDTSLRSHACLPDTFHTSVSLAMRTDAIGQWLRLRKLSKIFLVSGSHDPDNDYLDAARASIAKFGHRIVSEKLWNFETDLRRSASKEMPLFTQASDYDVVWVADASMLFGQHLPFNTWLPRPVIGTHGLRSNGWHSTIEQWGAIQLQNRFRKKYNRYMSSKDLQHGQRCVLSARQ